MRDKRKILSCMLICLSLTTSDVVFASEKLQNGPQSVEKNVEFRENGSGIVLSDDEFEGWKLSWDSQGFFDTLIEVKNEDYLISYVYEDGLRTEKIVNGISTKYVYDSVGRLQKICNGATELEYSYLENGEKEYLDGFYWKDDYYQFGFNENGFINEITLDGNLVAIYEYENDVYKGTFSWQDDNLIDMSNNMEFIGNINPIRLKQSVYDYETKWYYCHRYYCPSEGRYVDGIDESEIELYKDLIPEYELLAKVNTSGKNIFSKGRSSATISESEAVRRVLCLESPIYPIDMLCVAWVIKNRMESKNIDFASVSTPFQVISQKNQFTTYMSDDFLVFSESEQKLWPYSNYMYTCLTSNCGMSRPKGYSDQLYFSSVRSFLESTPNGDGTYSKGNLTYSKCWIKPLGTIDDTIFRTSLSSYRGGGYNVFCDKKWK